MKDLEIIKIHLEEINQEFITKLQKSFPPAPGDTQDRDLESTKKFVSNPNNILYHYFY
jgi:hypothetical protein